MKIHLFLMVFLSPFVCWGQHCLFADICQENQIDADFFQSQHAANNQPVEYREQIIIPVVVHIVWQKEVENISDIQVQSQIQILNELFQRSSADLPLLSDGLKEIMGTPNFEFCLTATDADGNPTNGITRTKTEKENIGHSTAIFYEAEGGKDAWDTKRFLNIWVCGMDRTLLGYGTPPNATNVLEDGVVINYRYFGNVGTATYSRPYHLGKTLVHEIGHYFNLLHPWGLVQAECEEDDLVLDTPIQDRAFYGCSPDGEESCGVEAQLENFMGNADDACLQLFTKGQVARMTEALYEFRPLLLENANCFTPNIADELELKIFPNPATTSFSILMDGGESQVSYELLNYLGWKIKEGTLFSNEIKTINLENQLINGLYFLRLYKEENELVALRKIVLQK